MDVTESRHKSQRSHYTNSTSDSSSNASRRFHKSVSASAPAGNQASSTDSIPGFNSSKPFLWNSTVRSVGSSRSSEQSAVTLDGHNQSQKMKGSQRLFLDCVLIPSFTPNPDEEYFINWDEFEVQSLKRLTHPAGRVEYHVTYKDGHTAVYSPAEIYNHVSPKAVERLENTYFKLELNAETYYDAADPEFPAGAPSGGTLLFNERGIPGMLPDKRRKRSKKQQIDRIQVEEEHWQSGRTSRFHETLECPTEALKERSSMELDTSTEADTSTITSRSSPIRSSILERALAALSPEGSSEASPEISSFKDQTEIMDNDINIEASAQLVQETASALNSRNSQKRGSVILVGTPRKSKMPTDLPEELAINYIAPFDDEEDEDFMPDSAFQRPAKRVKSESKPKQSISTVSVHQASNTKLLPKLTSSEVVLKPVKSSTSVPSVQNAFGFKPPHSSRQVPLTSLWKTFNTPSVITNTATPKRKISAAKNTAAAITPISVKTSSKTKGSPPTPTLATIGASPTEETRALFPAPRYQKIQPKPPPAQVLNANLPKLTSDNFKSLLKQQPSSSRSKDSNDTPIPDPPIVSFDGRRKRSKLKSMTKKQKSKEIIEIDSNTDEPAEEYAVEAILAYKRQGGKKYYLTKWLGYPKEQSTWEAEDHFRSSRKLIEDFESTRLRGG